MILPKSKLVLCLSQEDDLKVAPEHHLDFGMISGTKGWTRGSRIGGRLGDAANMTADVFVPWVHWKNTGFWIRQLLLVVQVPLFNSLNTLFTGYHLPYRAIMRTEWGEVHKSRAWHKAEEKESCPGSEPSSGNQERSRAEEKKNPKMLL